LDTGRAQIIVELESAIPRRFLDPVRNLYIHFLRLVPPDNIDINKLWVSAEYSDSNAESQKEIISKHLNDA